MKKSRAASPGHDWRGTCARSATGVPTASEQARDGALGDIGPELEELSMDSWCAPQGIGRGHRSDEGGGLSADRRTARSRPAGEPRPVLTEATALPPQDRVGRHDDQSLPPAGPGSGQPNPQEAIHRAQSGPRHRSFVHGELLTQGEVLQGELAGAAAEEREESNQMEHEGDHQARILSGSELIDQPLAHRMEFWRRTGLPTGARANRARNRPSSARGRVGVGSGRPRPTERPERRAPVAAQGSGAA